MLVASRAPSPLAATPPYRNKLCAERGIAWLWGEGSDALCASSSNSSIYCNTTIVRSRSASVWEIVVWGRASDEEKVPQLLRLLAVSRAVIFRMHGSKYSKVDRFDFLAHLRGNATCIEGIIVLKWCQEQGMWPKVVKYKAKKKPKQPPKQL